MLRYIVVIILLVCSTAVAVDPRTSAVIYRDPVALEWLEKIADNMTALVGLYGGDIDVSADFSSTNDNLTAIKISTDNISTQVVTQVSRTNDNLTVLKISTDNVSTQISSTNTLLSTLKTSTDNVSTNLTGTMSMKLIIPSSTWNYYTYKTSSESIATVDNSSLTDFGEGTNLIRIQVLDNVSGGTCKVALFLFASLTDDVTEKYEYTFNIDTTSSIGGKYTPIGGAQVQDLGGNRYGKFKVSSVTSGDNISVYWKRY